MTTGKWFLPTYNRPDRLRGFIDACNALGGTTTPVVVLVNGHCDGYADIAYPEGWEVIVLPENLGLCGALNWAFRENPGLDWYGCLVDDLKPETKEWDRILSEAVTPFGIISAQDGYRTPERMGTPVFGGNLLRAWGFWSPPGLWHCYLDDFWETVGRQFGIWTQCDVMMRHQTPFAGLAAVDQTHIEAYGLQNARLEADRQAYEAFMAEHKADIWGRMTIATGKRVREVSVAGKSIAVGTPVYDNTLHLSYHNALISTIQQLVQHGVGFFSITIPGDSMVHRARNHTLGAFLETGASHLLFIDADMGWNPSDVLRLLSHEKDLVCGLGVRKQDPPSFCGILPEKVEADPETGCLKALHAGTGFMLISRECVLKMIEAYPQTKYLHADEKTYHCLFEPVVRDERLWSEDYEFCTRWRALGGDVWVDPTVKLEHWGRKAWTGALIDHLTVTHVAAPVPAIAAE